MDNSSDSHPELIRSKRRERTILLIILFAVVLFGWYAFAPRPYVQEFCEPTYKAFAEKMGETDLPHTARNINFVCSSVGLGGRAHIYRFEAPPEDLKAYAIADYRSYDIEPSTKPPSFIKISDSPLCPDLSVYGIRNLTWFDVENIEEGITMERDHSHRPFTWIDTRQNVLYTFWTD